MSAEDDDLLSAAQSESLDADAANAFVVNLGDYEGPLHLLLDLARRQKVDLAHISILKLAEQYLEFVADARAKRMDLAADYLLMAAWLAFLKSKLLIPHEKAEAEELDGPGMELRLRFQLARLDAMRKAAKRLQEGNLDKRDVFRRGDPQIPSIVRVPKWTTSFHDLMKSFASVNARKVRVRSHVVKRQPVLSLEGARRRLVRLSAELEEWRAVQSFVLPPEEKGDAPQRSVTASFFSAALELTKEGVLDIRQDAAFADVYVRKMRPPGEAGE